MDWNGDGKHDWHDDAFIHTVIHSDDNASNDDPNSHWSPSPNVSTGVAIALIALIIISFFF